jgi:hypothetical protein
MNISSVSSAHSMAAEMTASQTQSQLVATQAQTKTVDRPTDGDGDAGDPSVRVQAAPPPGTGQIVDKYV